MFSAKLNQYSRRRTTTVTIGDIPTGSGYPVRLQSMTNTNTLDVEATVEQCIRIADAGADYVRCTAQGLQEAKAMKEIKERLLERGYGIPLIADVHFSAKPADAVAPFVDKVRINPGNFVDRQTDSFSEVNEKQYQQGFELLAEQFIKLLNICKEHNTAIRIGVNHGSLSRRIMSRYGDTPEGMVESAIEFLRICKKENFTAAVVSMKSSNTRIMVHAYRLLVEKMAEEKMSFPLHLGVTEAGEGEDGRVKSAVGIGTLLADGIGDTIRVSLTEEPENEIPVAQQIVDYFHKREKHRPIPEVNEQLYFPYRYERYKTNEVNGIGGNKPVGVVADLSSLNPIYEADIKALGFTLNTENGIWTKGKTSPDVLYIGSSILNTATEGLRVLSDESEEFFSCKTSMLNKELALWLKQNPDILLSVESDNENAPADFRAFFLRLREYALVNPVIIHRKYSDDNMEPLQIKAACDIGTLFIDGFGDAVMINAGQTISPDNVCSLTFSILQASRVRFSKTEYISCPSCGRTLFDLQQTLVKVKEATRQLSRLKIAVMGCIVNGPGEMADADYGYVGAGPGKISLYKGKTLVKKNIPQEKAVEELISLIKEGGDWEES
ncbi:MAG: (E)-4-hydroxy-3-methylbut-2-enyl-diphosphate synthase [Prevotellaceae bacterium]|jgi:(E)-4-hydroxy-3-methylbut-2-enyl-diphosphate synthase|nr:(E)-4-hydroxy-3-methylbut-2-enyl-diphosphate synthase [Prevotellaceae bacterium]